MTHLQCQLRHFSSCSLHIHFKPSCSSFSLPGGIWGLLQRDATKLCKAHDTWHTWHTWHRLAPAGTGLLFLGFGNWFLLTSQGPQGPQAPRSMMQHDPKPPGNPGSAFFLVSSGFTLQQDGKMSPGSFKGIIAAAFQRKWLDSCLIP